MRKAIVFRFFLSRRCPMHRRTSTGNALLFAAASWTTDALVWKLIKKHTTAQQHNNTQQHHNNTTTTHNTQHTTHNIHTSPSSSLPSSPSPPTPTTTSSQNHYPKSWDMFSFQTETSKSQKNSNACVKLRKTTHTLGISKRPAIHIVQRSVVALVPLVEDRANICDVMSTGFAARMTDNSLEVKVFVPAFELCIECDHAVVLWPFWRGVSGDGDDVGEQFVVFWRGAFCWRWCVVCGVCAFWKEEGEEGGREGGRRGWWWWF